MFPRRMSPFPINKHRASLPLLISSAILAVLATALVAHAASAGASIRIGSNAALANPPTSLIVSVDYTCLPSSFSFGQVEVDQLQPGGAASGSRNEVFGFGSFQPICDDRSHRDQIVVTSFSGSFIPGTAGASAFIASGAVFANASSEISIK
jgi:hypothetical protein